MNEQFRYGSESEAINHLRQKGFDQDFRLEGTHVVCGNETFDADDLSIAITYRYEGNTNPGDEATVYGIESKTGARGILIIADGIYADAESTKILKKLHQAKNEGYQEGA